MEDEAPVVKVDDLIRWGNSFVPEYNQMADSPITRQSPFPFNQEINMKIAYWNGDITLLNAHAVVCCNNESLTDNDPVTAGTLLRAGPELRREMLNEIKVCRTGEAKISKGYSLAARHVIHVVGPRYNIKYKTAAENALFNAYRNTLLVLRERNLSTLGLRCIHTSRRGYPTFEGAHIALRTVRRFLEKHGENIDLIVFVVTGIDREAYNSLLPLYFPRSPSEELYAAHRIPADIGNEDGEPVIAERKIRISANPSKESTAEEIADDDDDGDDYNDDVIREVLGTNQSIGEHAFSKMEENVDKQRLMKNRMSPAVLATEEERREVYERFLKRTKNESFTELSSRRFLYQSGFDKNNRPVVVFIANNYPTQLTTHKALMFFVHQMDSIVQNKYVFVYVHTLAGSDSHPSTECLKRLFSIIDSRYMNNLESMYMVHAGIWSKLSFWWFSTFNSPELKSKIEYLPGVEYLFARVPPDQIDLPNFVMDYDYQTNGIRYYNCTEDDL